MELTRRKKIAGAALATFIIVAALVFGLAHEAIVKALLPFAQRMVAMPGGFIIPELLLLLTSFPPLFGQDVVAICTGFIWQIGWAFLIVVVGTLIGESLVFVSFRHYFTGRLKAFREKHRENYGVFVGVIEQGGYPMVFFIRISAVPSHFTTLLFASIDPEIISYPGWLAAAVLSSWKNFIPVYVGHVYRKGQTSIVANVFLVFSGFMTLGVCGYIYYRYRRVRRELETRGFIDDGFKMDDDDEDDDYNYDNAAARPRGAAAAAEAARKAAAAVTGGIFTVAQAASRKQYLPLRSRGDDVEEGVAGAGGAHSTVLHDALDEAFASDEEEPDRT